MYLHHHMVVSCDIKGRARIVDCFWIAILRQSPRRYHITYDASGMRSHFPASMNHWAGWEVRA